jgi:DNA-binding HxlR family transcriptional regulator
MSPDNPEKGSNIYCPVAATMDLLNGKWTLHILRELMDGRKRFNELSRAIGAVSSRTLCCRLRALEEQGIVVREIKNTIPPWVEYELTEKGRALNHVIDSIVDWAGTYMGEHVLACKAGLPSPEPEEACVLDG